MRINSRAKGANGEREASDWLYKNLPLTKKPERNLEQVRSGGADLLHVRPFCIEVKRCEKLSHKVWWNQVNKAVRGDEIAIVMYRKNLLQWEFLIPATYIGIQSGFILVNRFVFKQWATNQINSF